MSEVVNCAAYAAGRRVANVNLPEVHTILEQQDRFVWIGLHEPSEDTLQEVKKEFNLHELAIEDAHNAHQRPKIEMYGGSVFIVLRTAQINAQHRIDFGETHFFIGRNFIVTIRHGSSIAYTEVRTRCENTPHLLSKGQGFALYAIMDSIVDQYFPVVNAMEEDLEDLEKKIFDEKPSRETTAHIYRLKHELLEVKRAVSPLIDICNRLTTRFDLDIISEETRPYFRDIYDHVLRINEMIDNSRELLGSALEANFSLISISQSEVSKKFAGWAAIIGVPTMVAGIYGMNFSEMPELHWRYGYPVVLSFTIILCVGLYVFFKRSGWL